MNKKVLIISKVGDAHIPFVSKYLKEEPIILDSTRNPKENLISFRCKKGAINIYYNDFLLNEVRGVWYRKPQIFRTKDLELLGLSEPQAEYSKCNINTAFLWLNDLLSEKVWVSNYRAIQKASNKLFQYRVASDLGFNVPEFILTNDSKKALDFINRHKQEVVIKPINTSQNMEGASSYILFSKYIKEKIPSNIANLHFTPLIFQKAILKDFDLRVTVVGEKVFSSKITINTGKEDLDWRVDQQKQGKLTFEAYDLSVNLKEKCVKLVKVLGLQYGAIDLVVKKGIFYFLEINPNGQWAFVDEYNVSLIGKELSLLLQGEKNI